MARPEDAKELQTEFARVYELSGSQVLRELERRVLGSDYGATSWATRDEAKAIATRLALRPGVRLLDVGAGSGWPGLYFSKLTGCDVVLADLPLSGLRAATERASREGLGEHCIGIVANGARLPLQDHCVDAISHSDVLCCLPEKLDTLRECRRVARKDATMVFSVIELAIALSEDERAAALQGAPVFVDTPMPYDMLLDHSGWQLREAFDITDQFADSLHKLVAGTEEFASELAQVYGAVDFSERLSKRRAALREASRGTLRRELFVAVA